MSPGPASDADAPDVDAQTRGHTTPDVDGPAVDDAPPRGDPPRKEEADRTSIRPEGRVSDDWVSYDLVSQDPVGGDGVAADDAGAASGVLHGTIRLVRETVQLVLVALLLAFIIKTFVLQAFFIPSGSMLQTLQIGDRVLVEKISYLLRDPQRGEVIVFRRPGLPDEGFSPAATWRSFLEGIGLSEPDPNRDLIKRIIALPGETVEMIAGVVHVNGLPLNEPYTAPETRDFPPVTVPEGEYYVLGDNRGNSLDSRFTLGTVPEENIIGRTFAIIWPPSTATVTVDTDYPGVGETPLLPQE